jgi:succinate dehydrogenase / fumarate reductase, flavoprotein subunit
MSFSTDCEKIETAVLVIGAGAAGLRAAIALADRGRSSLIIGKRGHGDAHTIWAAGGINASLGTRDPQDSWQLHAADTLREGHFICRPEAVELLAKDAPLRVRELQEWGCDFALTEDGHIDQRYFGAQCYRRTCFVGDRTGEAILKTLVDQAEIRKIPWRENLFVSALITARDGRVLGAVGLDLLHGRRPVVIGAGAVILAAGGYTSVYTRTTSRRDENTGDAVALAYRAGAALRDMEMVQFHPTGIVHPGELAGRLVTEAVRGEGGRLFNAGGERFMERYAPDAMELAARDVVARAIFTEIREGRGTPGGGVWLDISHQPQEVIRERLPKMADIFERNGIDISREPMEVAPTAHYAMGGVLVDSATGATTVPGLFAAGEATSGLHGANRLGGNSLAETVVFGRIIGSHLASLPPPPVTPIGDVHRQAGAALRELEELAAAKGQHQPVELRNRLGDLLDGDAGILRSADRLQKGLHTLERLKEEALDLRLEPETIPCALNLRFLLLTAEALLRSALMRQESRGAHFRSDFPDTLEDWRKNIICYRGKDGAMVLETSPVPQIGEEMQKGLAQECTLEYRQLE